MGVLAATVGILFVLSSTSEAAQAESKRKGRFFFVSTSTSTSTFTTTTRCYVKASSIVACTRKKRAIVDDADDKPVLIEPENVRVHRDIDEETEDAILNSGIQEDDEESRRRDARFLLYWATSTVTSTTTSYTSTSTLATLECTPTSYSLSICG